MRGFSFLLAEAAHYCLSNNLAIRSLKGVIATGEPLYDEQRKNIEKPSGARSMTLIEQVK